MTEKEKKELEPQLTATAAEKGQSEAQPTAVGKAKAAPRKKKAAKTTGKAGSGTKTRSKAGKKDKPKTAAEYLAEFEALAKKESRRSHLQGNPGPAAERRHRLCR